MASAQLTGRRALVVGGGRGIGRRVVELLAEAGAEVGVAARTRSDCEQVAKEIRARGAAAHPVVFDARDGAATTAAVGEFAGRAGGLDILVVTAGESGPQATVEKLGAAQWSATIESNLTTAYTTVHAAAPMLRESRYGRVVFTGAIGAYRGMPGRSAYCAAKAGLVGLTRALAQELGGAGVTVNCVVPGSVDGERLTRVIEEQAAARGVEPARIRASMAAGSALRTLVRPDDVAAMIVLLAGAAGVRITGQEIHVNAGAYLG